MTEALATLPVLESAEPYLFRQSAEILTPALVIYPDVVDTNIEATLRLLGGDANRWRPHLKTAKLGSMYRKMVERGIRQAKCATTLELLEACKAGFDDVLVSFAMVGGNARRVREIAERFSSTRISVLVEDARHLEAWKGSRVGVFVDLNPGMDRTGIPPAQVEAILELARAAKSRGLEFRGVQSYEGHVRDADLEARKRAAWRTFEELVAAVKKLEEAGIAVPEVITSGTPTLPAAASYPGFRGARFVHRVSSGTVTYHDCTSLAQFPAELGYRPAVVVAASVVSHPKPGRVTCDAGHKAVSADAGVPTCAVLGRPELKPLGPSEEHLPIDVPPGARVPEVGEQLFLVPRHVCPTVNNFDQAIFVRGGQVVSVETVSARGHEAPLEIHASHTD